MNRYFSCVVLCLGLAVSGFFVPGAEGEEFTIEGFTVTVDGTAVVDLDAGTITMNGTASFDGVEVSFIDLVISDSDNSVLSLGSGSFELAGLTVEIEAGSSGSGGLEISATMTLPENLSGQSMKKVVHVISDLNQVKAVEALQTSYVDKSHVSKVANREIGVSG